MSYDRYQRNGYLIYDQTTKFLTGPNLEARADDKVNVNVQLQYDLHLYPSHGRVLCSSMVRCFTRNAGVLGSSRTGSCILVLRGSVLGQATSESQPGADETPAIHE